MAGLELDFSEMKVVLAGAGSRRLDRFASVGDHLVGVLHTIPQVQAPLVVTLGFCFIATLIAGESYEGCAGRVMPSFCIR